MCATSVKALVFQPGSLHRRRIPLQLYFTVVPACAMDQTQTMWEGRQKTQRVRAKENQLCGWPSLWMKTGRMDWDRVRGRRTGKQASAGDVNIGPTGYERFDMNDSSLWTHTSHTDGEYKSMSLDICVFSYIPHLVCCVFTHGINPVKEKYWKILGNESSVK